MRIFPLGWELSTFLVLVVAFSAGALFEVERLLEWALIAVVVLTPMVILSAVLRAISQPRS